MSVDTFSTPHVPSFFLTRCQPKPVALQDGLEMLDHQPGAVIDYYSLMWLALQRSATAREAVLTMDALTRKYGYSDTGGERG